MEGSIENNGGNFTFTRMLKEEAALFVSLVTTALFLLFGSGWLADLSNPLWFAFITIWLFLVILFSAFAVVHHAESLAIILGEPLGTLVLTLSVIGVEVLMISAVMLSGEGKPAIARDTMFSVLMILLGGMAGISLLLGGFKHHEQTYNLQGAVAYLALIIPLSVIGLILPSFTVSSPGPTLSYFQSIFTAIMAGGIYTIFLIMQTMRHQEFFREPRENEEEYEDDVHLYDEHEVRSSPYHFAMLVMYILPLVVLAKQLAVPLEYATIKLNAPPVLSGFVVAVLILTPEAISAVKAALRNHMQRAVNILLGSVTATIGLTIPAVLVIGLVSGQRVELGLKSVDAILLVTLLAVSKLTFSNFRTNAMLGAVHLLIFFAYIMIMLQG